MELQLIRPLVQAALAEDLAWGDLTTDNLIDPAQTCEWVLLLKQEGVVAGLPLAKEVFAQLEPNLLWTPFHQDGEFLPPGTVLARVQGRAQPLLKAERVALNFLQRLSGIASLTRRFVVEAHKGNPQVRVVDTRKTTPGLRYLEKYAVRKGGGHNHRFCLSDAVMIKDNHLALVEQSGRSLVAAVQEMRQRLGHLVKVEIEVDRLDQIPPALEAGADCILLDNMTPDQLRQAVTLIGNRALTEASGGVRLETIQAIAASGVAVISVGALTHSPPALDISLDAP